MQLKKGPPLTQVERMQAQRQALNNKGRRIKSHRELLTHESLYHMATGLELKEGEPAGITLREAERWLEKWCLSGRAIDHEGNLVWSYDPKVRTKRTVGGSVLRLLVHNDHVWLCNANIKEFNAKYGGKEPTPPKIENTPDIPKKVSENWCRAPKPTGALLEIVTNAESVIALPETCTEAMTNGDPHKLALSLMAKDYEPGAIALEMGSIERFSIRIPTENGNREIRIRRAIEVAGDQAPFEEALTKRGQVVFETELDRIRACCLPRNGLLTYSKDLFRMFDRHSRSPRPAQRTHRRRATKQEINVRKIQ